MDPKKRAYFLNDALQSEIGKVKMFHFFVPVHWKKNLEPKPVTKTQQ